MEQSGPDGGIIFDVQGFSVHDGPGCRTLIFFKGCPLRCRWCSNPEGIRPYPEPLYRRSRCIFDLLCIQACPFGAIELNKEESLLEFRRNSCSTCETFDCVKACCTSALNKGGWFTSLPALFERIQRDRQYWGEEGGITLTGGEPFAQPEFATSLLRQCYEAMIHTAVETCGQVPWKNIELSLPWLDWVFFDLKHMDTVKHQEYTASSNEIILENARRLCREFRGKVVFRLPLVPGVNDDMENLRKTAEFLVSNGRSEINILPVHFLGREKFQLVGMNFSMMDLRVPSSERLSVIRDIFTDAGLKCYISSETPF